MTNLNFEQRDYEIPAVNRIYRIIRENKNWTTIYKDIVIGHWLLWARLPKSATFSSSLATQCITAIAQQTSHTKDN